MNCLPVIISVLLLIVTSSANTLSDPKTEISGDKKSLAEELATLLGAFSFVSVFTLISPFILKIAVMPLFLVFKLISKPFMMIGLTGYLMVLLTPLILARSGMTSPVFESRSESDGIFSSVARLMSTNLTTIASETMDFFDLDNDECKIELTCRLGKRISNTIPYLQYFVSQSGAANWIEDKYMAAMVRSMTDTKECGQTCKSLKIDDQKSYSTASYTSDVTNNNSDSVKRVFEWLG